MSSPELQAHLYIVTGQRAGKFFVGRGEDGVGHGTEVL